MLERSNKGVGKSDFAITVPRVGNLNPAGAVFFILESGAARPDATLVHKGLLKGTAEAVSELHRLMSRLSLAELHLAQVHIVFGSNRRLAFGVIQPIHCNGGILWAQDRNGPVFDLDKNLPLQDCRLSALREADCMPDVVFDGGSPRNYCLSSRFTCLQSESYHGS
ncbi:hypothetical protein BDZ88DRAFT_447783 [Geranomyces variabilis]|nr:hypothetical protein BDZ88DRAFT_447783 [Geranomyces variabilis]